MPKNITALSDLALVFILYALVAPWTGHIRCVGKSNKPGMRLHRHIKDGETDLTVSTISSRRKSLSTSPSIGKTTFSASNDPPRRNILRDFADEPAHQAGFHHQLGQFLWPEYCYPIIVCFSLAGMKNVKQSLIAVVFVKSTYVFRQFLGCRLGFDLDECSLPRAWQYQIEVQGLLCSPTGPRRRQPLEVNTKSTKVSKS